MVGRKIETHSKVEFDGTLKMKNLFVLRLANGLLENPFVEISGNMGIWVKWVTNGLRINKLKAIIKIMILSGMDFI